MSTSSFVGLFAVSGVLAVDGDPAVADMNAVTDVHAVVCFSLAHAGKVYRTLQLDHLHSPCRKMVTGSRLSLALATTLFRPFHRAQKSLDFQAPTPSHLLS